MKRLELLAVLASLVLSLGLGAARVGAREDSAQAIERGRQLYRLGRSARGLTFEARIAGSEPLPAAALPCAQCHGLDGRG
ncbi:MAG: ABC transporter substrate-binding protein, partial [Planctomycetes bacterium]|nr:ABC transporter substrate-binding protein [Planctomycetota bacterium]